jgi:hypothetical protein
MLAETILLLTVACLVYKILTVVGGWALKASENAKAERAAAVWMMRREGVGR